MLWVELDVIKVPRTIPIKEAKERRKALKKKFSSKRKIIERRELTKSRNIYSKHY